MYGAKRNRHYVNIYMQLSITCIQMLIVIRETLHNSTLHFTEGIKACFVNPIYSNDGIVISAGCSTSIRRKRHLQPQYLQLYFNNPKVEFSVALLPFTAVLWFGLGDDVFALRDRGLIAELFDCFLHFSSLLCFSD